MAPKMKSRQKASQEYWEKREKEALKQTRLTEEQFAAEIEKIYADMRRDVSSRISDWYVKYADESGIDIAEAKKRVSKLDMEEYAELARKYVELARKEETRALAFTDEANEQMKLYNLTMKVNRLENLKAQIGLELCGGFSQLEKKYGTFLTEQMMEEFDRQSGILAMTTQRPEAIRRQAEAVVNGSFHNATFSERLWNQQDALKGELDRLLSRALIQGLNPRAVAPELRKKFGASEQAADLLMITELCRVQTEAQKMAFQEYGYEEYTFICNGSACEACQALNGKHFKVKDMQPGLNAPPMHPRCRCSTAAYMDREKFDKWLDALENGEDVRWNEFKRHGEAEASRKASSGEYGVNWPKVQTQEYREALEKIIGDQKAVDAVLTRAKWALSNRDGKDTEEIYAVSLSNAERREISRITNQNIPFGIMRTKSFTEKLNEADSLKESILLLHNHPRGMPPSIGDINILMENKNVAGITVGHDGSIYYYTRPSKEISEADFAIATREYSRYSEITATEKALQDLSKDHGFIILKLR